MPASNRSGRPRGRPFSTSCSSRPIPKISSAYWNTTWPTSVSTKPRPDFTNSFSPSVSSSTFNWPLIVGCAKRNRSQARVTLPSFATAQKYRR